MNYAPTMFPGTPDAASAVPISLARGEERPDSDIDILVEFDPAARVTVFDYVGLKKFVEGLFDQD
jgi:hypothetical protein